MNVFTIHLKEAHYCRIYWQKVTVYAETGPFPNMKTYLYNFDAFKPHFYILLVKLGFTGVYNICLISAQKHRLWILVRTALPRRC